ncbi:MAG: NAD(P)-dependent oxidoreductase [Roseiflexaceae bacterium]
MRILVTGATGRVGSRFVPRLLKRGDAVRVLVRQPEQAQGLKQRGAELAQGDLLQPETLDRAIADVDAIIHLAAFFRSTDAAQIRAITLDGTLALAQAAIKAGVERFVFASTNLVYGPGRGRPAREDDEPQATQPYPASKVAAERALVDLHQSHGLDLRIIRLAFVYGEGDAHLKEGLRWFREWNPAKRIQMVHHADVGQALILAVDAPTRNQRIYNVADDQPISSTDILRFLGESLPQAADDRPLDDAWEGIVDTTRIRAELGYRPIYPSFFASKEAGTL